MRRSKENLCCKGWCIQQGSDVLLKIYLQPGSRKTLLKGIYNEAIKISVQALPIDGRANDALINWITELLDLKRKDVLLMKGRVSRQKIILVKNAVAEKISSFLSARLEELR